MRYLALATDYDGTLAHHGRVNEPTLAALKRLRASGRRLILVTGRVLDELLEIFPPIELFDHVVAENGALLYHPETRQETLLGQPPPPEFVEELRRRGIDQVLVGRVIIATWVPHEKTILEVIQEQGLELQVIFNKDAVMVLPSGLNKANGLERALVELGLSPHNVVAIGDAENDHAMIDCCEAGVAVSNALESLKKHADFVTEGDHGAGVVELIDQLLADDLLDLEPKLTRHHVLLGHDENGEEIHFEPHGRNILIAGTSGSGKSTLTTGVLERLAERQYQFCIIDPEGDYTNLEHTVVLGSAEHAPTFSEVIELLDSPGQHAVVNLLGTALEHRPEFCERLLPRIQEQRARTGRPQWLVIDEAHHLFPQTWSPATLPQQLQGTIFITVHPESVAPAILETIDQLWAVGEHPCQTIQEFCQAIGQAAPEVGVEVLEAGEVLCWNRLEGTLPIRVQSIPPKGERRRHRRKYAEGDLGFDRSFHFRGPHNRLNLRAQNLIIFLQMAEGIDDETWLYHLRRGDYSRWFREGIKDAALADEAKVIERQQEVAAQESLAAIRELIERHYTKPTEPD